MSAQKSIKMSINTLTPLSDFDRLNTQQKVFRIKFFHPEYSLADISRILGISYYAAAMAWSRLRRKHNLLKLCPICFKEAFDGKVCHNCGFEADEEKEYFEPDLSATEPAFLIQPHNGLGTAVDYSKLKLKYGARNIAHLVEHEDDRRLEALKSMLLEELKSDYPDPEITNLAARILKREYERFRALYPDLMNKKGFDSSLINGVLKELKVWLP